MGLRHRHQVQIQTILTAGTGMMVYGLSAVTGPLLAGALGPARRGDLTAVQVPSLLFGYLLCFGLPEASIYFAGKHSRRSVLTTAWAFALSVGGLVILATWWVIPIYLHGHSPETVFWLRATSIGMIAFVPVSVSVNLLRLRPTMIAYNLMAAFPYVANTVFIVALRVSGNLTLHNALVALFASQVLWYVFVIVVWRSWPGRKLERKVVRSEIHYGARVAIGSLAEVVVGRLDQFVLVGVVASRQLGLYAVSATAAGVSGPAAWGVALVLFPRIRHISDTAEGQRLTRQAMRWTALASSSCALIIAGCAPFFIPLLFGDGFRGSVWPLWLLLPGQVAYDVANVVSQRAMASNRPGAVSRAYAFAAVVTVAGLAIFLGRFGIRGAAVVTSVSQYCYLTYLLISVRRGRREKPSSEASPAGLTPAPVTTSFPKPPGYVETELQP